MRNGPSPGHRETKREQADQAQRVCDAHCDVAVEAENALIAGATEQRQEWLEALTASLERAVSDAAKAVAAEDPHNERTSEPRARACGERRWRFEADVRQERV